MEKKVHQLTYSLVMIQLGLCVLEGNIRVEIDAEEIRRLGDSLKKRQIHPIIVLDNGGTYAVIDGGKRVRAARDAGMSELLAAVTTERLTPQEILEIQLVTAFHRSDPSAVDKWRAMESVRAAHPDWTNARMAEHLSIDPKMVKVLLSPSLVIPEAKEAFLQARIGISVVHELSLIPPEQQKPLLDLKLSGSSRDAIAHAGRKLRSGRSDAGQARMKNVRFPLPSGGTVTLAGEEMALDDAIRELTDLLAEMRKAEKQNFDIRTFQRMARDRAKAGA